ncbi:hypothetical protein [Nocardioides kribbensis]|uniref:Uncharacterized protein n=1 Tax=Nocardioides kribbensis TaxID=305517 RepID=A0ABV1NTC4_9ACTN
MALFPNVADEQLVQRHVELEKQIAAVNAEIERLKETAVPEDLRTLQIISIGYQKASALLEEHTRVIGCLDIRGVRYPNWERYKR